MADKYTPAMDEVCTAYVTHRRVWEVETENSFEDEFISWLAEVQRKAKEEALLEAADEFDRENASQPLIELESRYAGYYSGIRQTAARKSERLREMAAEYRSKEESND